MNTYKITIQNEYKENPNKIQKDSWGNYNCVLKLPIKDFNKYFKNRINLEALNDYGLNYKLYNDYLELYGVGSMIHYVLHVAAGSRQKATELMDYYAEEAY